MEESVTLRAPTLQSRKLTPRDRFLAACRREPVDATPVWFMRQAGRYLPQYRRIRRNHSVMEICKRPELCEQVTLLPVKELGVDAAVMFADIMLPLEGMGVKFHIEENLGPVISKPIRERKSIEKLKEFDPKLHVPYVLEAIGRVKSKLKESDTALVGFSGAPFTIASYLIEGGPSRDFALTKKMMYNDEDGWNELMEKLSKMIFSYLETQIESGVDCVQLFDSWVGALSDKDYTEFVAPWVRKIFKNLKSDFPDIPTIHFGTNTFHLLDVMRRETGGDVFSIDWRTPISKASKILGKNLAIQGNLEPAVLLSENRAFISERVDEVLKEAKEAEGHIFNLGHGILRDTRVENAKFVVKYVHDKTSAL